MKKSESLDKFAPAWLKVQQSMGSIPKNSKNPIFGDYADLVSCVRSIRPLLSAHGFMIIQTGDSGSNGELLIETTLLHTSGQYVSGVFPMRPSNKAIEKDACQAYGSAISYGRRYGYMAIVSAYSTKGPMRDDDGNAADHVQSSGSSLKVGTSSGIKKPTVKTTIKKKATSKSSHPLLTSEVVAAVSAYRAKLPLPKSRLDVMLQVAEKQAKTPEEFIEEDLKSEYKRARKESQPEPSLG